MEHLPKKTCQNGISYTLVGDYYMAELAAADAARTKKHHERHAAAPEH